MEKKNYEFYSKDIQILKQSQTKLALEYVNSIGVTLSVHELINVAEVFIEICLRPLDDDLKKRIKNLDEWLLTKKIGSKNENKND